MLLQVIYLYSLYTRNLSSIFFVSVLDLLQAEAFESSCFECVNKSTISSFVLFLGHTKSERCNNRLSRDMEVSQLEFTNPKLEIILVSAIKHYVATSMLLLSKFSPGQPGLTTQLLFG